MIYHDWFGLPRNIKGGDALVLWEISEMILYERTVKFQDQVWLHKMYLSADLAFFSKHLGIGALTTALNLIVVSNFIAPEKN